MWHDDFQGKNEELEGGKIESTPVVILIDDDPDFRKTAERLIRAAGYEVRKFADAMEFLSDHYRPKAPACLVLDVRLPGLSGLDLQRELAEAGVRIPVIFLTGFGDIAMSVQAMKAGAVEFLTKPFRDQDLLDAILQGVERDRASRAVQAERADLNARYGLLTPRQTEVMTLVVSGMLNKQIAAKLGNTEKTVKFHRAHIMRKMQADSFADLVRMGEHLGLTGPRSRSSWSKVQ